MHEPKVEQKGYRGVTPESVAPGYVKPGSMSDHCRGGMNDSGEAQQSGAVGYKEKA